MLTNRLGRALAIGLAAVLVLYVLSSVSMPEPSRRVANWAIAVNGGLMLAHAVAYWFADALRARIGLAGYVAAQGAAVFLIGLNGALLPVGLALYAALTAETVVVAGPRWGTVPITVGAVMVFGANAVATSNLYFGATAALLLAITALVAQSIVALTRAGARAHAATAGAPGLTVASQPVTPRNLTPREEEVLQALTTGSRTSEIATRLGIAERTVKAHLQSIYQKLGVDSRTAAVAAALKGDPPDR